MRMLDDVVDLCFYPTAEAEAVELEQIYAEAACPQDVLGTGPRQFADYVEHVADRRLGQLDMDPEYHTENRSRG